MRGEKIRNLRSDLRCGTFKQSLRLVHAGLQIEGRKSHFLRMKECFFSIALFHLSERLSGKLRPLRSLRWKL